MITVDEKEYRALLDEVERLRATADDFEFRRWAVQHIKTRFAQWRDPPVETPADSWIDDVVADILRRAVSAVTPDKP